MKTFRPSQARWAVGGAQGTEEHKVTVIQQNMAAEDIEGNWLNWDPCS
jgi:hypothetical protein